MIELSERFLGIREVTLMIAYDNGMINREQSEDDFLNKVDFVLSADGVDTADLEKIDKWIQTLSYDDRMILAAGENVERVGLENTFHQPELLKIFEDIFEAG